MDAPTFPSLSQYLKQSDGRTDERTFIWYFFCYKCSKIPNRTLKVPNNINRMIRIYCYPFTFSVPNNCSLFRSGGQKFLFFRFMSYFCCSFLQFLSELTIVYLYANYYLQNQLLCSLLFLYRLLAPIPKLWTDKPTDGQGHI